MGRYLEEEIFRALISGIKENNGYVASWPNFANRADGHYFYNLAKDLGIDVFTSDLPVDVVLKDKRYLKIAKVMGASLSFPKEVQRLPLLELPSGSRVLVYAPTEVDFSRGGDILSGRHLRVDNRQLERILAQELALYKDRKLPIMVSLLDAGMLRDKLAEAVAVVSRSIPLVSLEASGALRPLSSLAAISDNSFGNICILK